MATTYTDQFFAIDAANPPPVGTALTVQMLSVLDSNDNGVLRAGDHTGNGWNRTYDEINGSRITAVYNGDTLTLQKADGTQYTVQGVTFYTQDGNTWFTPVDGSHLDSATYQGATWVPSNTQATVGGNNSDLGPPCFVAGTLIEAPGGPRRVEDLRPGDLVETLDRGAQSLTWVGRREVAGRGAFAPIRIRAGALGNERDLRVSPQHRMLVTGWRAELLFGAEEVLVAARHLVDHLAIRAEPCARVCYVHLLFDRHEVIRAEGALTESFHPGDWMMRKDAALRAEITALFPELGRRGRGWPTARTVVRGREAAVMREAC